MNNRGFVKNKQSSMAEFAAAQIQDMIISGRLKAGERLQEKEICEELGISRTPLREAFRILQTMNLLAYNAYHGVVVVELTYKNCMDQIYVRCAVEKFAVSNIKKEHVLANKETLESFRKIFTKDFDMERNPQEFFDSDMQFHVFVCSLADNDEVNRLLPQLWNRETLFRIRFKMAFDSKKSCAEHVEICDTLLTGDIDQAKSLMSNHIKRFDVYERYLREALLKKN